MNSSKVKAPYILNIETATEVCSVALAHGSNLLAIAESDRKNSHTETITTQIEKVLKEARITTDTLDAIAVSEGPGSYTGLRVGTSAAKGYAYALSIPLIAVPTLAALSARFVTESSDPDTLIIPMIDARRMEVYMAVYDYRGNEVLATKNMILDHQFENSFSGSSLLLCGNGSIKASELINPDRTRIIPTKCSAEGMIEIACSKYLNGHVENLATYTPFYLKQPNITKPKSKLFR